MQVSHHDARAPLENGQLPGSDGRPRVAGPAHLFKSLHTNDSPLDLRYPSDGAITESFAEKVNAAANNASTNGFEASGALAFLNNWTYKLGKELLAPFGRQQNFDLGVGARLAYGHLLQNFTEQGQLPVFRTQSQDRMVKTAQHFAAGFFGIPTEGQYNLEITVEADGYNNTGAPYDVCPNSNNAYGSVGSTAAAKYYAVALAPTIARLNKLVKGGLEFDLTDVESMLQMCAWETTNLGYSKFCEVFTEDEFKVSLTRCLPIRAEAHGPSTPPAAPRSPAASPELSC